MLNGRILRQLEAPPGSTGDDPVGLLPAADDASQVERHACFRLPPRPDERTVEVGEQDYDDDRRADEAEADH